MTVRPPIPRQVSLSATAAVSAPSWLWFTAIVAVAANLRPVITSVPPVVDRLAAAEGLSAVAAGTLTTLPVVCMGLFAPAAAALARRRGEGAVLAWSVALIAAGAALRSVLGAVGLYGGTAIAGIGIAVAGALLPGQVRARVPDRIGPVTGLYTAALIGGALLAAGLTEPLRAALGWSAQSVLVLWSLPAVLALLIWLINLRFGRPQLMLRPGPLDHAGRLALPWRSRAAWLGTLFMGGQSLLFYATLAWLASRYTALGLSAGRAGGLLAVFSATQVVTALGMPVLAHRHGRLRPWIAVSVGVTTAGLALVAFAPSVSPWTWAALLGLGMGGNLSLALTVLTEAAPSSREAASYTGMAFFVGYLLAAAGPVAAGAIIDATGGFTTVFASLAALGALTMLVGVLAAPHPPRA